MTKLDCPPLAFGIAEACAAAGVGRTSLYKAIRSGRLRAIKWGGRTLIRPDDLRSWLEGLSPTPTERHSKPSAIVRGDGGILSP
jgi:excisionase family DNA binding protein